MQQVGAVAYRLQLPPQSRIHPILHVSLLKQYTGPIPPSTVIHEDFLPKATPTPHAIVAERTITIDQVPHHQVLVEWQGTTREDATWENWDHLVELYTEVTLANKVIFQQGVNVTPCAEGTRNQRIRGAPSWAADFIS